MTDRDKDIYRRLRRTLKMLASPASVQIAYLERATEQAKYEILADDITTEFCCWLKSAAQFSGSELLSHKSFEDLNAIARAVEAVDTRPANWTAEALARSPFWAGVRESALEALSTMDAHYPTGNAV